MIKLFSVLVNSMRDERTNSTITWFNPPLRGNQNARTPVDMIQIGQWYGIHEVYMLAIIAAMSAQFENFVQSTTPAKPKSLCCQVSQYQKNGS